MLENAFDVSVIILPEIFLPVCSPHSLPPRLLSRRNVYRVVPLNATIKTSSSTYFSSNKRTNRARILIEPKMIEPQDGRAMCVRDFERSSPICHPTLQFPLARPHSSARSGRRSRSHPSMNEGHTQNREALKAMCTTFYIRTMMCLTYTQASFLLLGGAKL